MIILRNKVLIIEVGSSSVKYIYGNSLKKFETKIIKPEETGEDSISIIKDLLKELPGKQYIIGTAGLRKNPMLAKEIEKQTSIKPVILNGEKEANLTANAFWTLKGKYIKGFKNIISIDAGGFSTDIYILPKGPAISLDMGAKNMSKRDNQLKLLNKEFEKFKNDNNDNNLYALNGKRVNKVLGDSIIKPEEAKKKLSFHNALFDVWSVLGEGSVTGNPYFPAVGAYIEYYNGIQW